MVTVHPYLTFNGQCEEAFRFYAQALGKPLASLSRFGDMPTEPGQNIPEELKGLVLHVTLPLSAESILMGSDAMQEPATAGSNVALSLNATSREEAEAIFQKLSEGGKITMLLQDTFWGAYFGIWTDKFGIHWMVNYDDPETVQPH